MSTALTPPPWTEQALCAQIGGDLWFPETKGGSNRVAKDVCLNLCPVREQCLEYGLAEAYGVWGGLSVVEREPIRHERGIKLRSTVEPPACGTEAGRRRHLRAGEVCVTCNMKGAA